MRPRGSAERLQQRRHDALAMLKQGIKAAVVAKTLGISLVSVGRWRKMAEEGGKKALLAKPHPGRPLKLSLEQRQELAQLLAQGPLHHGYHTELWTLSRVAEVILLNFGVQYHPSQVWRILISLGWSCQKPQSKAREADEAAIGHWRKTKWPRIKKSGQGRQKRAVSR